ncbi:DUF2007 domain-containing protein [Akkermansiaceae bacterium]|nr:DUF2007 domain-containing protein [Akkermansiaceae bacterium]
MKEIYRHHEMINVANFRDVLLRAEIPCIIRNETLAMSGITEIPIPEFFPNLCVLHDEDEERALQLLRDHQARMIAGSDLERVCPTCKETNPGNFDLCYACQTPLTDILPC